MGAGVRRRLSERIRVALAEWCASDVVWGKSDCLMSLADIYRDVLHKDPAEPFRGRYTTERGARRVMGRGGVPGTVRAAARRMGWSRIEPAHARVGDLGVAMTANGPAGVIHYAGGWVGRHDRGFARLTIVKAAFRVTG